jgi:hypothetical protein
MLGRASVYCYQDTLFRMGEEKGSLCSLNGS